MAFSIIHREADATERAFLDRAGPRLARRDHARDGAHARMAAHALVEMKAVDGAYPLYRRGRARSGAAARRGAGGARRRLRRRRRSGAAGAARPQAARAHHHRFRHHRDPRRAHLRAGQARERHRLRPAAPDQRRMRCARPGLLQPGSLVRWHYRVAASRTTRATPSVRVDHRGGAGAIPGSRLGDPHPHQRLAVARARTSSASRNT